MHERQVKGGQYPQIIIIFFKACLLFHRGLNVL